MDIYAGKDPREVPAYGFAEAARYLGMPLSTLRSWTLGQSYRVRGEQRKFRPLIRVSPSGESRLSFFNLIKSERRAMVSNEQGEKAQQEEKGSMYLFDRYKENQYPGFLFFAKKTFRKKNASGDSTRIATASWAEAT